MYGSGSPHSLCSCVIFFYTFPPLVHVNTLPLAGTQRPPGLHYGLMQEPNVREEKGTVPVLHRPLVLPLPKIVSV
jgi:hypothetical protein